jgi:ubiquinone/menaquinone biosynthesis C-methylase UbiE
MSEINEVLLYYRKKAGFAEQLSENFQQEVIKEWLNYLSKDQLMKKWKVLDFGSGLGCNLKTLKNFFTHIVATDINTTALEISKKKYGNNIFYVLLKKEKLPFKDKTFDLVLANEVLEYVPDQRKTIKEIERIIKDSGYLLLSCPNYFNLTGVVKKFKDFKKTRPMWGPWGGHEGGLEKFTTWYSMEKMLKNFQIILRRGADYHKAWFYNNPMVPVRLRKYILLWPGKLPFINKLGMNYFILSKKK